MSKLLGAGLAAALTLAAGWMAPHIEPYLDTTDSYTQTEMQAAQESIALSLMGQLQFSVGDLLWMKTQEYLHGGLIMRMPTKAEEAMGYLPRDSVDMAAGLGHTDGVLMSPEKERDWRGILGDIHREIIPYGDHKHEDPVELIPWYQLVVRFNPHHERLYSMAAFFMSDSAQSPGDALAFLHKGLKANPWSWEIRGAIGRLLHDYSDRIHLLAAREGSRGPVIDETIPETGRQAYELAAGMLEEATELGLRSRVEMAQRREVFDEYQDQVFRESYLMLAQSYAALERWQEALDTCDIGYEITLHNHLKVQARTVRRDMQAAGVEPPPERVEQTHE